MDRAAEKISYDKASNEAPLRKPRSRAPAFLNLIVEKHLNILLFSLIIDTMSLHID